MAMQDILYVGGGIKSIQESLSFHQPVLLPGREWRTRLHPSATGTGTAQPHKMVMGYRNETLKAD